MSLSRLCRLKIVVVPLLPYAVFAVGSDLMHNHGLGRRTWAAALLGGCKDDDGEYKFADTDKGAEIR